MSKSSERIPISKRERFNIFNRDGFTCKYCGKQPPSVMLVVDHVIPVSAGGGNNPDNLTTSCQECNQGKSATSIGEVPESSRLSILQDQMEAIEASRLADSAIKARNKIRKTILSFITKNTDAESFDKGYLTTLVNISNEFGISFLFKCVDAAYSRIGSASGYNQKNFIMYICGIVKKHGASLNSGGKGVSL